ncbi:hypothetical protein HJFPF1_07298 [Paramyrothecium foliicola]|nr:hypothetical protein HJFPF1_07298 [Paramyrothecium foliicola]
MERDSKDLPPPPYEEFEGEASTVIIEPATLVFDGTSILQENAATGPLFHLPWNVTSIPQKGTSVAFESAEYDAPEKDGEYISAESRKRRLFYLAHPADAKFRQDAPAYYITSLLPGGLGNMALQATKSRVKKTEFSVLLSFGRTASHDPLFDEHPLSLFTVKPKWVGGVYEWIGQEGQQVAYEGVNGPQQKLVITVPLEKNLRDALVAAWCLRLWHDTAESREAKRDGESLKAAPFFRGAVRCHLLIAANLSPALERLTPAESVLEYNTKWVKKTAGVGALGSIGGA